jgi:hypothetical protein
MLPDLYSVSWWVTVTHQRRSQHMPSESYAAAVARHTAVMEELFDQAVQTVPDRNMRTAMIKAYAACCTEVERLTRRRIEASEYEYQRRQGKELATLGRVVVQRGRAS